MLSQKSIFFKMPLLLWAAFILVLSLIPPSSLPESSIIGIDKLVHLVFYFIFMWLCMLGWDMSLKKALVLAVSYGLLIEILQHTLTSLRYFDLFDVVANSIGALLFYVLKVFKSETNSR
jgi:VanZ family protein